ncbi:hypothetical protein ILUMI_17949 [Ignelater luminosus]|uniref:Uncharacterized protein n=1 Tax=Ignelater luminosus TaxID=2038154 RepID=A0A8K0G6V4_IGNLU|nr:hypothetical protein ILUMI_17949 [Ignelater luminosus]
MFDECNIEEMDIKRMWDYFKDILRESAKLVYGVTKINKNKKETPRWNGEIKKEVKMKKEKGKRYPAESTNSRYNEYKEQRNKVKEMVKETKKKSWEDFREKMEENYFARY